MLQSVKWAWAVATTLICWLLVSYQYREVSPPSITAGPSPPQHTHTHLYTRTCTTDWKVPWLSWSMSPLGHRRRVGPQLWVLFVGGGATSSLFVPQVSGFLQGGCEGGHHLSTAQVLPNSTGYHSHTQYGSPSSRPPPSLRRPVFPSTSLPTWSNQV